MYACVRVCVRVRVCTSGRLFEADDGELHTPPCPMPHPTHFSKPTTASTSGSSPDSSDAYRCARRTDSDAISARNQASDACRCPPRRPRCSPRASCSIWAPRPPRTPPVPHGRRSRANTTPARTERCGGDKAAEKENALCARPVLLCCDGNLGAATSVRRTEPVPCSPSPRRPWRTTASGPPLQAPPAAISIQPQ